MLFLGNINGSPIIYLVFEELYDFENRFSRFILFTAGFLGTDFKYRAT